MGNCCQKNPAHETVPLIISLQIEGNLAAVEKMLNDLSRSHYTVQVKVLGNCCQNPSRDTIPLLISLQIEATLNTVGKLH